jgi:hypothetical protein
LAFFTDIPAFVSLTSIKALFSANDISGMLVGEEFWTSL